MADHDDPDRDAKDTEPADDDEANDQHLFGIDLGRRGDRSEQKSRDAVDAPPPQKTRAANRTLTERLASAAAERDDSPEPPADETPSPEE